MSTTGSAPLRIVLYSHDSQGLGHTRRNLALAHALSRTLPAISGRTVSGLLITGEAGATRFEAPAGWDWLVLPGIQKAMGAGENAGAYEPRHLMIHQSTLIRMRSRILKSAIKQYAPHLLVADRHAFGVENELLPALARLRAKRPACRIVLGLREVLDSPAAARRDWRAMGDLTGFQSIFDEIWVYGDPSIHDPVRTGEIPASLTPLVRYTGYLAAGRHSRRPVSGARKPYVLTMAGGGSDGLELMLAAARAPVPAGHEHLIVTGPQMPKQHRLDVERAAGKAVRVVGSVRDALPEIREASAVVSMGGYNSVCEIMSTTTPALIVPRVTPRREQLIRAESLADHGLLDVCHPADLTPEVLRTWFAAVTGTTTARTGVDLAGLQTVGQFAGSLLAAAAKRAPVGTHEPAEWGSRAAV